MSAWKEGLRALKEELGKTVSANAFYSCYDSVILLMSFLHKDVLRFIDLGLSVLHECQHVI